MLRTWLSNHFYDFDNDPELVSTLKKFLFTCNGIHWNSVNKLLDNKVKPIIKPHSLLTFFQLQESESLDEDNCTPLKRLKSFGAVIQLLDLSPEDIAKQLTLCCFER